MRRELTCTAATPAAADSPRVWDLAKGIYRLLLVLSVPCMVQVAVSQSTGVSVSAMPAQLVSFQTRMKAMPGVILTGTAKLGGYDEAQTVPVVITVLTNGSVSIVFTNLPEWNETLPSDPTSQACGLMIGRPRLAEDQTEGCKRPGAWFFPFRSIASLDPVIWSFTQDTTNANPSTVKIAKSKNLHKGFESISNASAVTVTFDSANNLTSYGFMADLPGTTVRGSHLLPIQATYGDYRTLSGFQIPYRITETMGGSVHCDIQIDTATLTN